MFALMLLLMLMSHASVDFIDLSFVLPNCAYAYVASENQALKLIYVEVSYRRLLLKFEVCDEI